MINLKQYNSQKFNAGNLIYITPKSGNKLLLDRHGNTMSEGWVFNDIKCSGKGQQTKHGFMHGRPNPCPFLDKLINVHYFGVPSNKSNNPINTINK